MALPRFYGPGTPTNGRLSEGPYDEVVILHQGSRFEPRYYSASSRDQSCSTSRSGYHDRCLLVLNGERRPPQILPGVPGKCDSSESFAAASCLDARLRNRRRRQQLFGRPASAAERGNPPGGVGRTQPCSGIDPGIIPQEPLPEAPGALSVQQVSPVELFAGVYASASLVHPRLHRLLAAFDPSENPADRSLRIATTR